MSSLFNMESTMPAEPVFDGSESAHKTLYVAPENLSNVPALLGVSKVALLDSDYANGQVLRGMSLCRLKIPTPEGYLPSQRAGIIADNHGREQFFRLAEGVYSPELGLRGDVLGCEEATFYQKLGMRVAFGGSTGGYSEDTVAEWFSVDPEDVGKAVQEVDDWLAIPDLLDERFRQKLEPQYQQLKSYEGVLKSPTAEMLAHFLILQDVNEVVIAELEGPTDVNSPLLKEGDTVMPEYRRIGQLDLNEQTPEQQIVLQKIQDLIEKSKLDPGQQVLF